MNIAFPIQFGKPLYFVVQYWEYKVSKEIGWWLEVSGAYTKETTIEVRSEDASDMRRYIFGESVFARRKEAKAKADELNKNAL